MDQVLSYKEKIRATLLNGRNSIPPELRRMKSEAINKLFLRQLLSPSIQTVFTYVNYQSEVETIDLINDILLMRKKVCVPLVDRADNSMSAVEIMNTKRDLKKGFKGILEPDLSTESSKVIEHELLDIVVIPGVGFDQEGGRIGYGGGYYDRYLRKNLKLIKVGFAFDQQVLKKIATEPHDVLMDYIVTETTIYSI